MFYKARSKETGAMWDVWMTHHGGLYYLYLACDTKTDDRGANKVWVNGHIVDCRPDATNPASIGKFVADVAWRKGVNRITFALSTNHGRAWGVTARVLRSRT